MSSKSAANGGFPSLYFKVIYSNVKDTIACNWIAVCYKIVRNACMSVSACITEANALQLDSFISTHTHTHTLSDRGKKRDRQKKRERVSLNVF